MEVGIKDVEAETSLQFKRISAVGFVFHPVLAEEGDIPFIESVIDKPEGFPEASAVFAGTVDLVVFGTLRLSVGLERHVAVVAKTVAAEGLKHPEIIEEAFTGIF